MKVGLDVGGTKTEAVAVDDEGGIHARVRLATAWGPDGVTQTVVDAIDALRAGGLGDRAVDSVGIGMPGQVVPGSSHVTHAVNLGVADLDVSAAVGGRLGVPVRVENDVKAAAMGAYALRERPAVRTLGYLNLGTGVAAGIVRDGRLWRGRHGTAGEVGHISVDPHGPWCACGQHGCIEALAGGAAIARRWAHADALPVVSVLDAAASGDVQAGVLRAGLMTGVAAAIRILVLTADVDVVVLGGGLSALGDRLMTGVRADLAASAESSAFMRSLGLGDRVEILPTGSAAAAFGAALIGDIHTRTQNCQEAVVHG